MAEVVTDDVFEGSRRSRAPYDKYLDGQAWKLSKADFPTAQLRSMQANFAALANRRGGKCLTRIVGDDLYVKFIPNEVAAQK